MTALGQARTDWTPWMAGPVSGPRMPRRPPLPATAPVPSRAEPRSWPISRPGAMQHDGTAGRLAVRGAAIWYVGWTGSRFEVTPVEGVGPPPATSSQPDNLPPDAPVELTRSWRPSARSHCYRARSVGLPSLRLCSSGSTILRGQEQYGKWANVRRWDERQRADRGGGRSRPWTFAHFRTVLGHAESWTPDRAEPQ